ncbi:hypothetical protein O9A_01294 [Bartonella koehlerae C-29]|uniref:Ubiquitinol-cytochrome C reductase Fe-S subunit TAT signal domain-containing protein n=1 Tax=Bartonella koehlerae C-29 TaxID=1134510 RepID=A0A067W456_9HYPH|nr:hypothetical protein O9A_01294 [Bartonella koehlerae C-29]
MVKNAFKESFLQLMSEQIRRDCLFLVTGSIGAFSIGAVAWPFMRWLCQDKAVLANSFVEVDFSAVKRAWRGQSFFIRNLTV